jgi:hypothetical protein
LLWENDSREEIVGDTLEKRNIVGGELGYIDIIQSLETNEILRPVGENSSLVTTSSKNRLDSSHTEIIMELR